MPLPPRTLLSTRAISFHHCDRVHRPLIDLAQTLGFNEVQLQMENGNMSRLRELAEIQRNEKLLDFIHGKGMKVSVWLHEFEELPSDVGPISLDNKNLWNAMRERYRLVVHDLLPEVDIWVLTVVESAIRVTNPEMLSRLVAIVYEACRSAGKKLVVRSFVWHPDEFEGVMAAIKSFPTDVVVMTKVVPQDWHLRGPDDRAIGAVEPHEQLIEFDIAGEYFYRNKVANCFPDVLARQVAFGRSKGVKGICIRVDRGSDHILHMPQEINLWALAAAAGCRIPGTPYPLPDPDELMLRAVWEAWATQQFGTKAARAAVAALESSGAVVAEALCVGPFSFGDTRRYPPFQDPAFTQNWQPHRWEPSFLPLFERTQAGDQEIIRHAEESAHEHETLAAEALRKLEENEHLFLGEDYQFLHAKLVANLDFIQVSSSMKLAYLRMVRWGMAHENEKNDLRNGLQRDLDRLQELSAVDRPTLEITRKGTQVTVVQRPLHPEKWMNQLEKFWQQIGN